MTIDELRKLAEGCHNAAGEIYRSPISLCPENVGDLYQMVSRLASELAELKAAAQRAQTSGGLFNG
jgi:uncharacterized protein YukE